jgi:hypothetical protein
MIFNHYIDNSLDPLNHKYCILKKGGKRRKKEEKGRKKEEKRELFYDLSSNSIYLISFYIIGNPVYFFFIASIFE